MTFKTIMNDYTQLPPLITTKEAAEIARCSVNHITALCRGGKVKATRLGARDWRISTADFLAYLGITD